MATYLISPPPSRLQVIRWAQRLGLPLADSRKKWDLSGPMTFR